MTSVSEAVDVMNVVIVCHHRTAPRMDDEQATIATATVWAELFSGHGFSTAELIAAVKKRAAACPDAPEPADIIRVAHATRVDRMDRDVGSRSDDDEHYPGDAKAAPDPADYPAEWDAQQRRSAYWYARSLNAVPRSAASWEALAVQREQKQARRGIGA